MSKPTLILLPGLVCDKAVWGHQVEALSSQVDIIIPDLSQANTPEAMVEAVLKHAPAQFMLAGHSMGGWVALEVMRHAEKRVTKLALLNTTAKSDTPAKATARFDLMALYKSGDIEVLVEKLLSVYIYQQHCRDTVKQMIVRNLPAFINQEEAMLKRESCEPVLPHIHCPTLIISANQDKIFNEQDAQCLKQGIPHATLIHINDCGHLSPLEAPEVVTYHLNELIT